MTHDNLAATPPTKLQLLRIGERGRATAAVLLTQLHQEEAALKQKKDASEA